MDDPPPPYDFKEAPPNAISQQSSQPSSSSDPQLQTQFQPAPAPASTPTPLCQPASQPSAVPFATALRSQQPIGVYAAGLRDVALALSASTPVLAHVTIHSLRTPSIALHSGPTPEHPVLATAQYNFLSPTAVCVAPRTAAHASIYEELAKTSWLPDAWGFEMTLPASLGARREKFEWKYSRGAEVAALDGLSRGLKCVRAGSGELVCVWAWSVSLKKAGKFRWLARGPSWGEEAELMVVITLLAVVERIKRDERKSV